MTRTRASTWWARQNTPSTSCRLVYNRDVLTLKQLRRANAYRETYKAKRPPDEVELSGEGGEPRVELVEDPVTGDQIYRAKMRAGGV
jgi:hypothetical protein